MGNIKFKLTEKIRIQASTIQPGATKD